jgi:hypothetical protein
VVNVWTVHATLAEEIRPTQAIYRDEKAACNYAAALSRDDGVLAASVVRFTLDELGTRANVAMFVAGERQAFPYPQRPAGPIPLRDQGQQLPHDLANE